MQLKSIISLLCLIFLSSVLEASQVTGKVTLENQTIHENILVYFEAISNSAVTKEVNTNESGEYNINLDNGLYKLIISKESYTSFIIDEIFIDTDTILNDFNLLERAEKQVSGIIEGTLYRDTTYYVTSDLVIEYGNQLVIQPGTHIKFDGNFEIRVFGKLLAEGEKNDSILFTSNNTNKQNGDWESIVLLGNDTSKIKHAILEYGGSELNRYGLITAKNGAKVLIENCRIEYSERGGIYLLGNGYGEVRNNNIGFAENTNVYFNSTTDGIIKNNFIHNSENRGIYHENKNVEISDNHISGCYAGIWTITSGRINNNVFSNCNRAIYLFGGTDNLIINNNTLINNTYGVGLNDETNISAQIVNNVFYRNNTGIGHPWGPESQLSSVSYNLFYDNDLNFEESLIGFGSIVTKNANNVPSDTYYNIFENPLLFLPNKNHPYYGAIQSYSPAINASSSGDDIGAFTYDDTAPSNFNILSASIINFKYDSVHLSITWDKSTFNNDVSKYIYYKLYILDEDTVFRSDNIDSTFFDFKNINILAQNTNYNIKVLSSNGLISKEAENIMSVNTPNIAPSNFEIDSLNFTLNENYANSLSLNWTENLDTDELKYSLMLGLNDEFVEIVETIDNSITIDSVLIENGNYECFVIASDGQLTRSSDTVSFSTANLAPSNFQIDSAVAVVNDNSNFELFISWSPNLDTDSLNYSIMIGKNQEFYKIGETNTLKINIEDSLSENSTYNCFIIANDGQLNTSSDTVPIIIPNLPPENFQLQYPKKDSVLNAREFTFSWNTSEDKAEVLYQLLIYNDIDEISINEIDSNRIKINIEENLMTNSKYFWVVSATDGLDTTFSEVGQFFTSRVLSINEIDRINFNIYPNPTKNLLNLDIPNSNSFYYSIVQYNGNRLITNEHIWNNAIDVSDLQDGVYLLEIKNKEGQIKLVTQFIKY